jgi:hypothetical protein
MAKSFIDRHPPRVNWDKLRKGPTTADLQDVPPASAEEWRRDGYRVSPLPDDVARKLERPAKGSPRRSRRKSARSAAE